VAPIGWVPIGVVVVEHVRVAGEFSDEIGVVKGEVGADADLFATQLGTVH
jgi:hypothetical protein